ALGEAAHRPAPGRQGQRARPGCRGVAGTSAETATAGQAPGSRNGPPVDRAALSEVQFPLVTTPYGFARCPRPTPPPPPPPPQGGGGPPPPPPPHPPHRRARPGLVAAAAVTAYAVLAFAALEPLHEHGFLQPVLAFLQGLNHLLQAPGLGLAQQLG